MDKTEKYIKMLDNFLNFIRENLDLNEQIYYSKNEWTVFNKKMKIFATQYNIEDKKIILGLIEELNIRKFLICHETKEESSRTSNSNPKSSTSKKNIEIIKKYYVAFKVFSAPLNNETIFFAREFNDEKTKKVYMAIKIKLESELNLTVVMLEDDTASGNIQSRIKNEIKYCKYFIADLTYKNSNNLINGNVMFEIGMAKAYGKPCLLIMNDSVFPFGSNGQNIQDLPFDISSHTTLKYRYENEDDVESILKCIQSELRK